AVLKKHPSVRIIALTNHDEVVYVRKMMRSGARGYLLKGTDKSNLLSAIDTVSQGQSFLDRQIEQAIVQQTIVGKRTSVEVKLTKREDEILALIASEYSNQEIADKLFLSVRTVESHRHSLNQKLNIKSAAGLVKEALLRGLVYSCFWLSVLRVRLKLSWWMARSDAIYFRGTCRMTSG